MWIQHPRQLKGEYQCRLELQLSLHLADISQSPFETEGTVNIIHSFPVFKRETCSVKPSLKLTPECFLPDISASSSAYKVVDSG